MLGAVPRLDKPPGRVCKGRRCQEPCGLRYSSRQDGGCYPPPLSVVGLLRSSCSARQWEGLGSLFDLGNHQNCLKFIFSFLFSRV